MFEGTVNDTFQTTDHLEYEGLKMVSNHTHELRMVKWVEFLRYRYAVAPTLFLELPDPEVAMTSTMTPDVAMGLTDQSQSNFF